MSAGLENLELKSGKESQETGALGEETLTGDVDKEKDIQVGDLSTKCETNDDGVAGLESNTHHENENLPEKNEDKECASEDRGAFDVSDLVWGKVRSHPWWPGQIFDPADSSEEARKYSKKDGFLIAYFGDQSFAWNEASRIKPFHEHFSIMEKQSKSESFAHAVDCALDEVSRRVEFGLACPCLSEEVYDKLKTQSVVNAGIREESSRRESGDEYSKVASFLPLDLFEYAQALARSPLVGTDRLKLVTARAQLLAFNRHKGFSELAKFEVLDGTLEDGVDCNIFMDDQKTPSKKEKLSKKVSSSRKRKKISGDDVSPSDEDGNLSEFRPKRHSSSSTRKMKQEPRTPSAKKRKADSSVTDDPKEEKKKDSLSPASKKQFFKVGESIRKVIPALKDGRNSGLLNNNLKKPGSEKVMPAEYPLPDEMLSHLYAAARDPLEGSNLLHSSIGFLSEMRNLFSLENFTSRENKSSAKASRKQSGGRKVSTVETTETSGVEGIEDSYWTDRVIESNTQEQVILELDTPNENGVPSAEPGPTLDHKEETPDHIDEKCEEESNPTALILNFTDIESVPSQSNLNNIFRRYGSLNESGTEVLKKSKRAKVIFKRRADAETAFSSSGKFSIFGPSLVSYRLHYLPSKPVPASPAKKRSKKGANAVEGDDA